MKHRKTLTAACLVLFGIAAVALAKRPADDPVTGNWGRDGVTFLELKFDGKRTVSGTAIWRRGADSEQRTAIKQGSFDPQTGALRLSGEVKNREGQTVEYVIEGKVEKEIVTGTYNVGGEKGEFRFTRL